MKNMKRFLILFLMLGLVMSVAIFAEAGEPGTIKEITYAGADYEDGDVNFNLTYDEATENGMYLILVLSEEGTPKDGNILYVNQVTADADGVAYFENVYPTEIGEEESYIYIAGAEGYKLLGKIIPNVEVVANDVTVVAIGKGANIPAYTVDGHNVTVTYSLPCKVGYAEADGSYTAIAATDNGDGSYSYVVPETIDEVIVVVKGDATGDGLTKANDCARMNATVLGKTALTEEARFAADVTGDGVLKANDCARLNATVLGKTTLKW